MKGKNGRFANVLVPILLLICLWPLDVITLLVTKHCTSPIYFERFNIKQVLYKGPLCGINATVDTQSTFYHILRRPQ